MISDLSALVDLAAKGGYFIAAVFVLAWWLERKDRHAKEDQLEEAHRSMAAVYEKTISLTVETEVTVEKMHAAVLALTDSIRTIGSRST